MMTQSEINDLAVWLCHFMRTDDDKTGVLKKMTDAIDANPKIMNLGWGAVFDSVFGFNSEYRIREYDAIGCSIVDSNGLTYLIAPHDFTSLGLRASEIAEKTAQMLNRFCITEQVILDIYAVASGEKQVGTNDTDALAFIASRLWALFPSQAENKHV